MDQSGEDCVKYGSNEWLLEMKSSIDKELETRQNYTHEIFMRFYYADGFETKHYRYTDDISEFKDNLRHIINVSNVSYKEVKLFVRRLIDNYTLLVATKKKGESLEITENYFKL
jgi:hypothetical protein